MLLRMVTMVSFMSVVVPEQPAAALIDAEASDSQIVMSLTAEAGVDRVVMPMTLAMAMVIIVRYFLIEFMVLLCN